MRSFVPAVALVAALLAAGPAPAGKPKLSEVADQARKPPAPEQPTPPEGLSQEKTKQPVATLPPPTSPPTAVRHDSYDDGGPWHPPYLLPPAPLDYVLVTVDPGYDVRTDPWADPWDRAATPKIRGRLGLVGGGGGVATDAMDGYGAGGLLLGMERAGWSLDLRGWRSSASFGRELTDAFRDLHAWSGDLVLGVPLNPGGAAPPLKLLAGARAGRLDWHFRNAVLLSDGPGVRQVSRDTLGFAAFFAGLDLEVFREAEWALGAALTVGRQRFAKDTGEGFENDLFRDATLVEGALQLVFFPSRPLR